MMSIRPN